MYAQAIVRTDEEAFDDLAHLQVKIPLEEPTIGVDSVPILPLRTSILTETEEPTYEQINESIGVKSPKLATEK